MAAALAGVQFFLGVFQGKQLPQRFRCCARSELRACQAASLRVMFSMQLSAHDVEQVMLSKQLQRMPQQL
eukprot:1138063-Pelagomonas_calceolata.AAC.5